MYYWEKEINLDASLKSIVQLYHNTYKIRVSDSGHASTCNWFIEVLWAKVKLMFLGNKWINKVSVSSQIYETVIYVN